MDKKIQEIREALAGATPGPYRLEPAFDEEDEHFAVWADDPKSPGASGTVFAFDPEIYVSDADKEFITDSWEYISYLLQQIDDVDQSKINILAARDNERNLKEQARRTIDNLRKQIEIKDKAIGFYANRENWRQKGPFRVAEMDYDNGKRARAALKGEDTNE